MWRARLRRAENNVCYIQKITTCSEIKYGFYEKAFEFVLNSSILKAVKLILIVQGICYFEVGSVRFDAKHLWSAQVPLRF